MNLFFLPPLVFVRDRFGSEDSAHSAPMAFVLGLFASPLFQMPFSQSDPLRI